jgi:hypothetical protein
VGSGTGQRADTLILLLMMMMMMMMMMMNSLTCLLFAVEILQQA